MCLFSSLLFTTCAAFEMFNATFYKMLSSNYPNILEIISNYCFLYITLRFKILKAFEEK